MFNQRRKKNLLFWSLEFLIVMGIILMLHEVSFLFTPISIFISSIFVPILVAGVLFYLLNPIVKILMQVKIFGHRISRTTSVAIIFILIAFIIYFLISTFVPEIIQQISNLISNMPHLTRETIHVVNQYTQHGWLKHLPVQHYLKQIQSYVTSHGKSLLGNLSSSLNQTISMATNLIINLITIPVVLFYMLKDGYKLKPSIVRLMPRKHHKRGIQLLNRMSDTISHYIDGQMIECLFVGSFTAIGYLLIHQPYAILLGAFSGMCVIMPYVGPYIGITPAIIIALTNSVTQVIWVIVVVLVVGQIDGNLIYPNVIGKSLQIHPLTIIVILLAAGHIWGLFGMILAVPLYGVAKTVVEYAHHIIATSSK